MSAQSVFSKNFLVSFGDLLTLLLCFFILTYEQRGEGVERRSEQNQVVVEKLADLAVQKIGTAFAPLPQSSSKIEPNWVKDTTLLSKRFSVWERASGRYQRRTEKRQGSLRMEQCGRDASIERILTVAQRESATVTILPKEACSRMTTLWVRR